MSASAEWNFNSIGLHDTRGREAARLLEAISCRARRTEVIFVTFSRSQIPPKRDLASEAVKARGCPICCNHC